MNASFIVIDGLDGCGKGTQIKLLHDRLWHEGKNIIFTREPGGAPLSEAIRELFKSDLGMQASALTQMFMMWASRREYLEKVVWPSLEMGVSVFSDRGDSSTFAYQVIAKNHPVGMEKVFWEMRETVFEGVSPTLYIFLAVPPAVARGRVVSDAARRDVSHFDAAPLEFYQCVHQGFCEFGMAKGINMVIVEGVRTPEIVHEDIYEIVARHCGW